MKKLFFSSLLALLCCIAAPLVAQNDSHAGAPKTGLKHLDEDLRLMTLLTNVLDKDGLINKSAFYKLEIKDGELSINDKKQSAETTNKYRQYFRKDKNGNYTILNNGDGSILTSKDDNIFKDNLRKVPSVSGIDFRFDGVPYQEYLKVMNQLIDGLHKDGLIDKKKTYKLEVKKGDLYINGQKQPIEVSDKYRKYFQSDNYALMND